MIRPTPRALWLLAAGLPLALLPTLVHASLWPLWAGGLAGLLAVLAWDGWGAWRRGRWTLAADLPAALHVGAPAPLHLRLAGQAPRVDLLPETDALIERAEPTTVTLDEGAAELTLALRPLRRGTACLHALWLRWHGPLGLMEGLRRVPLERSAPVLPDTPGVQAQALQLLGSRSLRAGLHAERFVGEGSEFDALRRHVSGLDPRSIDWKASARHGTLLSRQYRAERDHQLILVLDCGQLMGEPLDGLTRLDRAVHSALLLATVALHAGDRVGLFAFDSAPRAWVPPGAGAAQLARLREAVATLEVSPDASNPTRCLLALERRLSRRALVVVLTDSADDLTARLMVEQMGRLSRRHLVLFVTQSDPDLEALVRAEPRRLSDVGRAVVADELIQERARSLQRARHQGVQVLQARHDELATALVNRYLAIQRRELV